ncbi:amino acid transporter putative [Entamoeba histolytica]|uniref:Amino acid transporter putative n=1 Tax=Entamoeba histolytica TaxID=5759 RepID=A0A175JVR6_ENTHI|nr:amino acid transporter putative [Entamoeba histolytica]
MFFNQFFTLLREGNIEDVVIEKIFNELFFTYTVCQNVNDPFLMMYDDEKRTQLVPVLYKLEFVALVIQNLYTNTSLCEGFLIDLQQTIRKFNGLNIGEKMFKYMDSHPATVKEEEESEEEKERAFNNLLDAIRNNIQGILDLLPGNLSNQLLEAIKLEKYVYDDYQIYHATMDTINTFTQAYNAKINKLDTENMLLKNEYDKLFKEQQELVQQLDALERKLGQEDLEKLSSCLDDDLIYCDEFNLIEHSNSNRSSRDSSRTRSSIPRPISSLQDTSPTLTPRHSNSNSQKSSPKQSKLFSKFWKTEKEKEKEKEKQEKKDKKDKKEKK